MTLTVKVRLLSFGYIFLTFYHLFMEIIYSLRKQQVWQDRPIKYKKENLFSFLCHWGICDAVVYSNSPVCVCLYVCLLYRLYSKLKKSSLLKTTGPISTKVARIIPWVKGFQSCSKNLIPHRNLVAMATKRN
jgi:hypothetical protein